MHNLNPKQVTEATPAVMDFRTTPDRYRHWTLSTNGIMAQLVLDVDETATAFPGYELKLNSYDIGVDVELYDAIQRLRFEHPEVKVVVLRSGKPGTFCAGANIRMLGGASHDHKVNFCKFTNETRNAIEDASAHSGQRWLCALNGTAAGGGYELALATDHIMLMDDGNAAVSMPEVPLLAVLPGTGGLTRLVDKRKVRRDHADFFCTVEEGIKGKRALEWRLVDELVARSSFDDAIQRRALAMSETSDRPQAACGIRLLPIERNSTADSVRYSTLHIDIDHPQRVAHLRVLGPSAAPPTDVGAMAGQGVQFWPLALARQLDDALLHLRFNEADIGTLVFHSDGDLDRVAAFDEFLRAHADHWLVREVVLFLKRTFKRVDVTSRSLFALVEQGSCFAGFLAELLFAADRVYMLDGRLEGDDRPPPSMRLSAMNFDGLPMANCLSRLATRLLGEPDALLKVQTHTGTDLDATQAAQLGLVTFTPDDIDWGDEIRLAIEERASYSPDALTGMEANLRFAGPETLETKIFGRLSAWQNWIFQRPNAVGEHGALPLYGSGRRPEFDKRRV